MKKQGLLNMLAQVKARNEQLPMGSRDAQMTALEVLDLVLRYTDQNDPDIRKAVDSIPF